MTGLPSELKGLDRVYVPVSTFILVSAVNRKKTI